MCRAKQKKSKDIDPVVGLKSKLEKAEKAMSGDNAETGSSSRAKPYEKHESNIDVIGN